MNSLYKSRSFLSRLNQPYLPVQEPSHVRLRAKNRRSSLYQLFRRPAVFSYLIASRQSEDLIKPLILFIEIRTIVCFKTDQVTVRIVYTVARLNDADRNVGAMI